MTLLLRGRRFRPAPARAAWRAWTRGDIGEAERLAAQATDRQAARLQVLTSYVTGRYERALEHHAAVRADRLRLRDQLDGLVALAWLHLGQPGEAAAYLRHRLGDGRVPPDLLLRVQRPLRVTLERATTLPFLDHPLTPFLPAVEATIDGRRLPVHLDTGGPFLVMGTQRAAALGIPLVPSGPGRHGATRTTSYAGTARELTLGEAVLTNVPVTAMPTLTGEQDVVLIGTNVLQQFLSTVDHPGRLLLLSARGQGAGRTPPPGDDRPEGTRVPFFLWADHYMFARGGFGPRHDLNFFIDSGLVHLSQDDPPRQACLSTTAQRYRSWGVPRARAAGPLFEADGPVRLGPLSQHRQLFATSPTRRVPWASFGGVQIDGLLSHAFLNRYAWTLDFDRHEYTFGSTGVELH